MSDITRNHCDSFSAHSQSDVPEQAVADGKGALTGGLVELPGEVSSSSLYDIPRVKDAEGSFEQGLEDEHADEHGESTGGTKSSSWVKRMQTRTDELRALFNLPAHENLMDDYVCALKKKVILQGRLYVFEQHLGFYSNLFSYKKKFCIKLEDVTSIRRRKNVGLPNSIKVCTPERNYFFTSFLSRDDAYRLIMHQWRQCSEHAKLQPVSDHEYEGQKGGGGTLKWIKKGVSKIVARDSTLLQTDVSSQPDLEPTGRASFSSDGGTQHDRADSEDGSDDDDQDDMAESVAGRELSVGDAVEWKAATNMQCEEAIKKAFQGATDPAPPVTPSMRTLVEWDLPCSPREFWFLFMSNLSTFFIQFHEAQGHHSVKLGKWQEHAVVGMVRDLQFVTPLKMKMGPPQTLCNQTQRYQVCVGDHLVFETSQVQLDIPYGDHFKVETRWDVTPTGDGTTCHIVVHLGIPFSKGTMWKSFIEKGTTDTTNEAVATFKRLALETVQKGRNSLPACQQTKRRKGPAATAPAASSAQVAASPVVGQLPLLPGQEDVEALLAKVDPQYRQRLRDLVLRGGGQAQGGWAAWVQAHGVQVLLCLLCALMLWVQLAILRQTDAATAVRRDGWQAVLEGQAASAAAGGTGACPSPASVLGEVGDLVGQLGAVRRAAGGVQQELDGLLTVLEQVVQRVGQL